MNTLDRYILWEYLRTLFLSIFFLSFLVIIVRLFDKDLKQFGEETTSWVAIQIILLHAPRRILEIVPVSSFLTAFFLLGKMVQNNELMAMKSAGLSVHRISMPIFLSTFLICVGFAVFYNRVASPAYHLASKIQQKMPLRRNRNVVFQGLDNRLFFILNLDLEEESIDRMTIYDFDDKDRLKKETYAQQAQWERDIWNLKDGFVRQFEDGVEMSFEPFEQKTVPRREEPQHLVKYSKNLRGMTIKELQQRIHYKKRAKQTTRREAIRLHHKMAYPFAAFVVVLIGIPISIRFGRAGFFSGLVIAFFLNFIYWGFSFAVFEGLGENGILNPFVACWSANAIYALVGVMLLLKTPQ
ncbi:LptF/LptG family permease [Candidatus Poribacteria bacterium]|nr:LptF/LptG family permease [Candidatus Poribacteria bacterium]